MALRRRHDEDFNGTHALSQQASEGRLAQKNANSAHCHSRPYFALELKTDLGPLGGIANQRQRPR